MRTRLLARKTTVIGWINSKFGSLAMFAALAGVDTSHPQVRHMLKQVETSREPVVLSIRWKNSVIQIDITHGKASRTDVIDASAVPLEALAADAVKDVPEGES